MKRVLCLLLSLSMLFGCDPAKPVARNYLRMDHGKSPIHGHTAYADMVLSYPDPDTVIRSIEEALKEAAVSTDQKECIAAYEAEVQAYNQLVSATSLAYVRYCQDTTDERRAAEAYRTVLSRKAEARFSETLKAAGLRDPFEAGTIEMTAYGLGNVRRNRKSK